MNLKKVRVKRIKHYRTLPDYNASTFSYSIKEPIYTVELNEEEYKLLIEDLHKNKDKKITYLLD